MPCPVRLVATLLLCLAAGTVHADQLRVAVASNFAEVLGKLGERFTRATGHELLLSPGASGAIYTQIVNGAPFDVFFSADQERPERLAHEGRDTGRGAQPYAAGRLVLWSSQPALVDVDGEVLGATGWRHLAIASPAQAPYGRAARETLVSLGLWDDVQPRLVQGENITQALQFVQTGNAELGFIAWSQYVALPADQRGSAWEVPAQLHSPILQAYVVLRDTPASRALVDFLATPGAREIIEQSGYDIP